VPAASVIFPAYLSHSTVEGCLRSLDEQTFRDFEVIVVDSSPDERTAEIVRRFPEVQCIRPDERLLPHEARNLGAQSACGDILVFTDPDCDAHPEWLSRLVDARRQGRQAVAGAVRAEPGWWHHAVHWVRYGWWMSGGKARLHPEAASSNGSFSRALWEQLGGYDGTHFSGDSKISWRSHSLGHSVWFVPEAIVTHRHPLSLRGLVRDRWSRGRDFALIRMQCQRWSRSRCLAYLLAGPILPSVMTLRAARHAADSGRLVEWAVYAPFQLLFHSIWCAAEWLVHLSCATGRVPARAPAGRSHDGAGRQPGQQVDLS